MERDTRLETRLRFLKRHLEEIEANFAANLLFNETLLNTVQLVQRAVDCYRIVNPTSMDEGPIPLETIRTLAKQFCELIESGRRGIMKSEELLKRPNYLRYFKMRTMRLVIKELQEIHATLELSSFATAHADAITAAPAKGVLSATSGKMSDVSADTVSAASSGKMSDVSADTVSTALTEAMAATSADPLCTASADAVSAPSSSKICDVSADTVSTALTEAMADTSADPLCTASTDAVSAPSSSKICDVSADTAPTAPTEIMSTTSADPVCAASSHAESFALLLALAEAADDILE